MPTQHLNANDMGVIFISKLVGEALAIGGKKRDRLKGYRECRKMLVGAGVIKNSDDVRIGISCDTGGNLLVSVTTIPVADTEEHSST